MRSTVVTGPGVVAVTDRSLPVAGPADVVIRVKACGICGSDAYYTRLGGIPPRQGDTPLGHEPAGQVAEVGAAVTGVRVGDHVVVNPMANRDGLTGSGGAQGALSEEIVLFDAQPGIHFRVIPDHVPWEVAALNEPMAVAYHGVNRSGAGEGSKVVVFGAGPIGLGAAIGFKIKGAASVVVVDILPSRLETALKIGADAVINSATEDVEERLKELHGEVPGFMGRPSRPGTDVYLDAAGAPAVIRSALSMLKHRAVLTIVAVHSKPIEIELGELLDTEADIRFSMGYPDEIFEVTDSIIAFPDRYRHIVSDVLPFDQVEDALRLASTPGAADKVVVTFD